MTGSLAVYPSGQVTLREVGLRDGLQLVKEWPDTNAKRDWLDAEYQAGVRHFEIGSFLPAKRFPQFADISDVIKHVVDLGAAHGAALALNERGVEDAIGSGIDEIVCVVSATEEHSQANMRRSREEALELVRQVCAQRDALAPGKIVNVGIAMAFGCTLTMSRLGSVLNFTLTKMLFNAFFGVFYNGEATMVSRCENTTGTGTAGNGTHHVNLTSPVPNQDHAITVACQSALGATFWCGSGLVALSFGAALYWIYMHDAEEALKNAIAKESLLESEEKKPNKKKMKLSDICEMSVSFWLVVLTICAFYCIVFPFMAIAPDYIAHAKLSKPCEHLKSH